MSKWIRNYNPSEIDADEWGNILVLSKNGNQSVQQWQDYIDDGMQDRGHAWMPLPESDIPQSVSVTIEVGNKTYTVENNGFTIEVHDSRDPMGQPTTFETSDTIEGILEAVDSILSMELSDDCECEEELDMTALTVEDLQDMIEAEAHAEEMDAAREHLNSLRGNTASKPASKQAVSKPWKNKIGSYNVG